MGSFSCNSGLLLAVLFAAVAVYLCPERCQSYNFNKSGLSKAGSKQLLPHRTLSSLGSERRRSNNTGKYLVCSTEAIDTTCKSTFRWIASYENSFYLTYSERLPVSSCLCLVRCKIAHNKVTQSDVNSFTQSI